MALYLDLGSYHITKSIESFSLPALRYGRNTPGFPSPSGILAADLGKSVNVILIPQLLCRHTHVISVTKTLPFALLVSLSFAERTFRHDHKIEAYSGACVALKVPRPQIPSSCLPPVQPVCAD